jgi:GWxTD domain-containing protein
MKKILVIITLLLAFTLSTQAQFQKISKKDNIFYFDPVVFNGPNDSLRVDVYVMVPFESLNFIKKKEMFSAQYTAKITITDEDKKKVADTVLVRVVKEDDYFVSQGGTGSTDYFQVIMNIEAGSYIVEVEIDEPLTNNHYERKHPIKSINFDDFNFSLSGILLISSIEEKGSKYVITPHISNNVGVLKDGFFAFFESYDSLGSGSVDFVYELMKKDELVVRSKRKRRDISKKTQQNFLNIEFPNNSGHGHYKLNIYALKPDDSKEFDSKDVIAMTSRNISFYRMISGYLLVDINEAIEQLQYAATNEELNYIKQGSTQEEKQVRLEEFWRKKDPTEKTDKNEAFDEYYSRVAYANSKFGKTANKAGWTTDKGMVFIIFGEPNTQERTNDSYDGRRKYERWNYRSRSFVFEDNGGFGNWRLTSAIGTNEKFEYNKTY